MIGFFLFIFSTFAGNFVPNEAHFGVWWKVPNNVIEAKQDLSFFQKYGYEEILIQGIVPVDVMDVINQFDFKVNINLDVHFLTESFLDNKKDELRSRVYDFIIYYKDYPVVKRLGLFTYGELYHSDFVKKLENFKRDFEKDNPFELFYSHQPDTNKLLYDLDLERMLMLNDSFSKPLELKNDFIGLVYAGSLEHFSSTHFQQLVHTANGKTIFLPSQLIFDESLQAPLLQWVTSTIKDSSIIFEKSPLPKELSHPNYLVILFWICVLIFGLHFSFEPNYRKSVSRYFFAHNFFITDVMDNRIHLSFSTFLAGLVQSIIAGIMFMLFFNHVISPLGQQAFVGNFAYFNHFSQSRIGLFAFGFIHYVLLQTLFIFWTMISFKSLKSLHQPAILLLWPQLVNIFICILTINAFFNQWSSLSMLILGLLYLFFSIGSFYFAIIDAMISSRSSYFKYIVTLIPFTLLLILFFGYYLNDSGFYDSLDLALHLK